MLTRFNVTAISLTIIASVGLITLGKRESVSPSKIKEMTREVLQESPELVIKAIETYKTQQEAKELKQIQEKIDRNKDKLLNDATAIVVGDKNAKQKLIVFYDNNCGHCRHLEAELEKLKTKHPQVALFYRQFPIMGENSQEAAKGVIAIAKQNKFSDVNKAISQSKEGLDGDKLLKLAKESGLNMDQLKTDMASSQVQQTLQENIKLAQDLGLIGTPMIIFANGKELQLIPNPDPKIIAGLLEGANTQKA